MPRISTRGKRFPPEVLSADEMRRLLAACGAGPTASRNRALLAVLYRTGLRISEALALRPKDLDLDAGAVRVLVGKGGRPRTVGVDAGAAAVVLVWLEARARRRPPQDAALFCLLNGGALTDSYVRVLVPRLARRAGIDKRVHAHGLRHTHASELRAEGVDIGIISKQLGHRSISTTARYLDHIAPWAVIEAVRSRKWGIRSASAGASDVLDGHEFPKKHPAERGGAPIDGVGR